MSGFHEFLYEPDKPLHGDLSDYAYHQRGALAYVVELWDLFKHLGIERKKPFVDHYSKFTRQDMRALAEFDRRHNGGRIFKPWKKVRHPQIGEVEVGGFDPRVGIWNPPYERLAETCQAQSAAFLRVASLVPRVEVQVVRQEREEGHTRIELRIVNRGYLATHGLPSAKSLPHAEPLRLTATGEGVTLIAPAQRIVEIGRDAAGAGQRHRSRSGGQLPGRPARTVAASELTERACCLFGAFRALCASCVFPALRPATRRRTRPGAARRPSAAAPRVQPRRAWG